MDKSDVISASLIVPVFNEEKEVQNTAYRLLEVAKTLPFPTEVVFVNDGSSDKTGELLATISGIRVLTHPFNRGYGAALQTGLNGAHGTWLGIVDCDGTYPIGDLKKMFEMVKENPELHMVVGARKIPFRMRFPLHKIARWILRKMVNYLTGVMVPDLNSGMRIFKRSIYREFRHLLPFGFSFTTTITVAALFRGYTVKYLPISYGYRTGKSHIRPIRDFIGFVILITRLASYFDPLRFFTPVAFITLILAVLRAIRDIIITNGIGSAAVILVFFAINSFLIGVIADVVVKRANADPFHDSSEES